MGLDIFTIRDKKQIGAFMFVLKKKKNEKTHFILLFKFQVSFIKEVQSLCMLAIIHCFPKKSLYQFFFENFGTIMSKLSVLKPWFSVK